MTKVGRLYEEEKIEAVNRAVAENTKKIARNLLLKGIDYLKVMDCTGLLKEDVLKIQEELNLPDVI